MKDMLSSLLLRMECKETTPFAVAVRAHWTEEFNKWRQLEGIKDKSTFQKDRVYNFQNTHFWV